MIEETHVDQNIQNSLVLLKLLENLVDSFERRDVSLDTAKPEQRSASPSDYLPVE